MKVRMWPLRVSFSASIAKGQVIWTTQCAVKRTGSCLQRAPGHSSICWFRRGLKRHIQIQGSEAWGEVHPKPWGWMLCGAQTRYCDHTSQAKRVDPPLLLWAAACGRLWIAGCSQAAGFWLRQ